MVPESRPLPSKDMTGRPVCSTPSTSCTDTPGANVNWSDVTRLAATEKAPDAVAPIASRPEAVLPSEGTQRNAASVGDAWGRGDGAVVTVHSNGMFRSGDAPRA